MWELDCEEGWVAKNCCFWTVVLEKTLETPLDCKEIQPVHSEGDQPWDFFGRNDAKAEGLVLRPPHAKSWLIGKDSDAGRDCGPEEKGKTEDEMARWHHGLNGHESEWTLGDGDDQGGLACCDSWGGKESDTTERLNWCLLWRNVCLGCLATFWLDCFFFWYWAAWAACIFWRLILCQLFAIIVSHSEGCLFTLLIDSFVVQKLLSLIRSHLFIFVLISTSLVDFLVWKHDLEVLILF